MRKRLKAVPAESALGRVLEALKQELIDASDEEISAAARELRMNLEMPESAAFAGLTYPARPLLSDFFELEVFRQMRLEDRRASRAHSAPAPPPRRRRKAPDK